ncbi:MAG: hypothetical protein Q8P40_07225, partial [Nitrospirota bacterium]|nr:hypothetical protein [Nitrospirota bacterium]
MPLDRSPFRTIHILSPPKPGQNSDPVLTGAIFENPLIEFVGGTPIASPQITLAQLEKNLPPVGGILGQVQIMEQGAPGVLLPAHPQIDTAKLTQQLRVPMMIIRIFFKKGG